MGPVCADDKDWRAESDMNTLIRAREITKDPSRLAAAQDRAKQVAKAAGSVGFKRDSDGADMAEKGYRRL